MSDTPDTPNPGSDAAKNGGCTCPVLDNNHGRWSPHPPDGWYIFMDCPMHALGSEAAEVDVRH